MSRKIRQAKTGELVRKLKDVNHPDEIIPLPGGVWTTLSILRSCIKVKRK